MDAGTLSKLLNGQRPLGPRVITKMALRLALPPDQLDRFLAKPAGKAGDPKSYPNLEIDRFQIIAEWQHFAILELMKTRDFKSDAAWIAKMLKVSVHEVKASLGRLESVGMIAAATVKGKRVWRISMPASSTLLPSAQQKTFTTAAHRTLQKQFLEKAIDALEATSVDKRHQSGTTMAIDSNKLGEARDLVADFRRKMAKLLAASPTKDSVYQLSVSLFPLSTV